MISLSAHKLGGPPGVGALVLAADLDVAPALRGGGQERGRRAGTENLPGIAGFGAAAQAALAELGKGGYFGNVLRIKPPMCLTEADIDFLLAVLDVALGEYGV